MSIKQNPIQNASKTSIFLTGKTALQILQAAQLERVTLSKSTLRQPPNQAPIKRDIENAIEWIQNRFPALKLVCPIHIIVGESARCRSTQLCIAHQTKHVASAGSFMKLTSGIYVEAPALCFARLAAQQSKTESLKLGFELCGTYCTHIADATFFNTKPLLTVRALNGYAIRNKKLRGATCTVELCKYLSNGSASPRETQMALLLGLPLTQGGSGLGMPHMNYQVEADRQAQLIANRRFFRCDLCWPEVKLDVEYQSRVVHEGEESRIDDSRRTNALESMGWTVINVTNDELDGVNSLDVIAATIRKHLGKDMRIRTKEYYERKLLLRSQLGLPINR